MKGLSIICNKMLSSLLKLFHRGGSLPGSIALKLHKNILKELDIKCPVILVTGTNGKTSTTNMISDLFEKSNNRIITNRKGDNLRAGITTCLLNEANRSGEIYTDYIILEVDELNIPYMMEHLPVTSLVVTNFFRDQLDRAREMEQLIQKIEDALIDFKGNLILNGNDPNVVRLKEKAPLATCTFFGFNQYEGSVKHTNEAAEGKFCPVCQGKLIYDFYQYSHIGKYHCENCDFKTPENMLNGSVVDINAHQFSFKDEIYTAAQGGVYTMYNCMAVLACATVYNIDYQFAKKAFIEVEVPDGRNEHFIYDGHNLVLNLVKNPTGANEVMKVVEEDENDKTILIVLNDNPQDGTDVSWIYDTHFEKIIKDSTKHIICGGSRCYDMALRLKYGGYRARIEVEEDLDKACESLLSADHNMYAIVTYTALQPTRKSLRRKIK